MNLFLVWFKGKLSHNALSGPVVVRAENMEVAAVKFFEWWNHQEGVSERPSMVQIKPCDGLDYVD